tara:strand:+ start:6382 stop:6591 length:210 start_codon:yes stop_codon:yes gene_type:complete
MKQIEFSCRIVCDDDDGINAYHLCEEIQAYLNSNHHLYDEDSDEYANAKVTGYKVLIDNYVPFIAQDEY